MCSSDLVITEPGTVVKDKTVAGDVIIAASVGSGDVTLDNVTIHGDLLVKGGANAIHLANCTILGKVIVDKASAKVSFEGSTTTDEVVVNVPATLEAKSFKGALDQVTITDEVNANQTVTIKVPVKD